MRFGDLARAVLHDLRDSAAIADRASRRLLSTMACHTAVRANRALMIPE
jgi:hypothetical protein